MSLRPELISPLPSDPGAASMVADLNRRVDSLQGLYGVFGSGMTVTGATFTTADTGGRTLMSDDGPDGGSGLYSTDGSGTVRAKLTSGSASADLYLYDSSGNGLIRLTSGPNSLMPAGLYAYTPAGNLEAALIGGATPALMLWAASGANAVRLSSSGMFMDAGQFPNSFQWQWGGSTFASLGAGGNTGIAIGMNAGVTVATYYSDGTFGTQVRGAVPSGQVFSLSGFGFGVTGNASATGSMTASSYVTSSDARLKRDVKPLPQEVSRKLHDLRPVRFNWRHDSGGPCQIGLIAQEVQDVLPELVLITKRVAEPGEVPDTPEGETPVVEQMGVDLGGLVHLMLAELQGINNRLVVLEEK